MVRLTALALGILALFYSINVKLDKKPQAAFDDEDLRPKKVRKVKKARAPASVAKKTVAPPAKTNEQFRPEPPTYEAPEPEMPVEDYGSSAGSESVAQPSYISSGYSYGGSRSGSGSGRSNSDYSNSGNDSTSNKSNNTIPVDNRMLCAGCGPVIDLPEPPKPPSKPCKGDECPQPEEPVATLTCSSNKGGGAYANPIAVGLTCSSTAKIQYCLSQGACCDPKTSGTSFTSNVIVGADSGSYCLSFYGESSSLGKSSSVTQLSYTINNTLPDIQVNHPQTFYQTTQLSGRSFLKSNDFEKLNFEMGQISLKSNNPGSAACEEIVTNYVSLPAPAPAVVLSPLDMSTINLSQQANVPFSLNHLTYGDNFITSYVVNKNYATPLYACSTTKINLSDFEYFQADVSQASAVASNVREFSGEFTVYGFFEPDITNPSRGPAGSSSEDQDGRSLKSGLFGIFF